MPESDRYPWEWMLKNRLGIREIFAEAKSQLRSIIIVDQLERLDHKRGGNLDVTSALSDEMVKLDNEPQTPQIIIIGATNAIGDLDENLRSPGPFVFEIDIPIPDIRARNEILRCLRRTPADMGDPILEALGERTHGYTGADLRALLRTARSEAAHRRRPAAVAEGEDVLEEVDEAADSKEEQNGAAGHGLLEEDLDKALLCIRPSAMRELVLEVPKVRWSDIGGQEKVKKSLREAVEWPLKYPERMKRIGTVPKKGLLLYGPPGCSKTLTAKALATEAGFNFIAVKGPELQSMWVGETERALRNVFAKARAASPSIIFFDEVDSIGAKRRNVKNNSLSMLETLLNEMDGIETLKGVFVLAATNKPDSLDLALLRPGRLDSMLYVAPPDLSARRDILRTHLSRMDVADTVDVEGLAARTEGHSGAEIVEICQKAGYMALGDSIDANTELQIGKEHFEQALAQVPRQITEERRTWYEEWTVEGVKKM
ncbi:MAG: AAA+-type ATPase [Thelocarpon impressellum]|nr:MAG: AAA+-type ATPase [Thelocarpon impressellum]